MRRHIPCSVPRTMRLPLALSAVAACLIACSSAGEEQKPSLPADAIAVEASATTREELGVTQWGLEQHGAGDFNGYDDDLNVRVSFQRLEQVRDGAPLYAYVVKDDQGAGRVVFTRDATTNDFTILESTLEGKYQRVAELLGDDLSARPRDSKSSSPSLTSSSLKPLSPMGECKTDVCLTKTNDCIALNDSCTDLITDATNQQPKFASACPLARDPGKLSQQCTTWVAQGKYKDGKPTPYESCKLNVKGVCDGADNTIKGAKQCSTDQRITDCRAWLGLPPITPVK